MYLISATMKIPCIIHVCHYRDAIPIIGDPAGDEAQSASLAALDQGQGI